MEKVLEIENLNFAYDDQPIFQNLSLSIEQGKFCAILCANRSGKSTFARILYHLEETHDYIKINQMFLNPKNIFEIRKNLGLLVMESNANLLKGTVEKELALALSLSNGYHEGDLEDIVRILELEDLLPRLIHTLSDGEKEIVFLACELIRKRKLLILDDALAFLDEKRRKQIFSFLKQYVKEGTTILYLTSSSEIASEIGDVYYLENGKIAFHQMGKNIFTDETFRNQKAIPYPFVAELSHKLQYYKAVSSLQMDDKKLVDLLWK